ALCPASSRASSSSPGCSPRPRVRNRSCGGPSHGSRPLLVVIGEVILAAEFQQGIAVLRKRDGFTAKLRGHARVVKNRVPHQVRQEYFHQRRPITDRALAIGHDVHCRSEWPLESRHEQRAAPILRQGERLRQLAKRLRSCPRRKMIRIESRLFLQVQRRNRVGYKVNIYDVNLVVRPEWQHAQAREEYERLNHIELRGFGVAAVA